MKKMFSLLVSMALMHFFTLEIQAQSDSISVWKMQLNAIQQNAQQMDELNYPLLQSYEYVEEIRTADEVEKLKNKLFAPDSYSLFDESGKRKFFKLKDIQQSYPEQYDRSVKPLFAYVNGVIVPPVQLIKLTWDFNAKKYETLMVASDQGILYDPIISNMLLFKENKPQERIRIIRK